MKVVRLLLVVVLIASYGNGFFWGRRRRRRRVSPVPPPPPPTKAPCFTDWSNWSCNCQSGISWRTRRLLNTVDLDERERGPNDLCLDETSQSGSCSTDCVVSIWAPWGPCTCDKASGKGIQERSRLVVHPEKCGGTCPFPLKETQGCSPSNCCVDCAVSDWGPWASVKDCSQGAKQTFVRKRTIVQPPSGCGQRCPALSEQKEECCPKDCAWSWSPWGPWSSTCGDGKRSRTSVVSQKATCGGTCQKHVQTEDNIGVKDVDCQVGGWSTWSPCIPISGVCGLGSQERTRTVTVPQVCSGKTCLPLREKTSCPGVKDVDCQVGDWSTWSPCILISGVCGPGSQERTRSVTVPQVCFGKVCPSLQEKSSCPGVKDVDCQVGDWSSWSTCVPISGVCGPGSQERTRTVTVPQVCSGKSCSPLTEKRSCPGVINVDCQVGDWSSWSTCIPISGVCGPGSQDRTRAITVPQVCSGKSCSPLMEKRSCPGVINVDCQVEDWSTWSHCIPISGVCGPGSQKRTRTVTVPQVCSGKSCPSLQEKTSCPGVKDVDCQVGYWSTWSPCIPISGVCGPGSQERNRIVTVLQVCSGKGCPTLREKNSCPEVSRDCQVSDWSEWSTCKLVSGSCGAMKKERTRAVTATQLCSGNSCPKLKENTDCPPKCCPVDCVMNTWSDWGSCSVICGQGEQLRSRTIKISPTCGGSPCPATLNGKQSCTGTTPVPCTVGDWSDWSPCDNQCGHGQMTRVRSILVPAQCKGTCPALSESTSCESYAASRDCLVNDWGHWGFCSKKCDTGVKYRSRSVSQSQYCRGSSCPPLQASTSCGLVNGGCEHQCQSSSGACSCNSGYLLNNDGKTCRPKDCGPPSLSHCPSGTSHGTTCLYVSFSCGSGTTYQQKCSVVCSVDYELKDGPSTISCESSGAWTPYHSSYCSRINKPPTKIKLSDILVAENVTPGFAIGTFTTTDPNPKDTHSYQIVNSAGGKFKLSGSSLLITFSPDYETQPHSYTIKVRSTDNKGLYLDVEFTVYVRDINEEPIGISLSNAYFDENSDKGTVIGVLSTNDPDKGQSHAYLLLDDANGRFSLNGKQIQIAVSNIRCLSEGFSQCLLNFEKKDFYTVKVRTQDNGTPSFYKDVVLTIHLRDINDRPRRIQLSAYTLPESAAIETVFGTLSAVDEDSRQLLTWTLSDDALGLFGIQFGNKLALKRSGINYEAVTSYKITAVATDNGKPSMNISKQLTVEILDVNEPPFSEHFTSTGGQQSFSVDSPEVTENSSKGTVIGTLAVLDPDANEKLTINLDGTAGGKFSLKAQSLACKSVNINNLKTKCTVSVTVNGDLNYEVATSHSVSARVTDKKGHVKTAPFTIKIINVNDAPTDIKISSGSVLSVEENKNSSKVNSFDAVDEDKADTHTCELTDSAGGRFVMKSNTLMTSPTANLNYELQSQYNIAVRCTDSGSPRLHVDKSFTVQVVDVNEVPTTLTLTFNKISENSLENAVVGRLVTTDPDNVRTVRQTFTYTVIDSAGGRFKVEKGLVKVALSNDRCLAYGGAECKINYESAKLHTIIVRVTDDGSPSLQKDFTLTVIVKDENDQPRNLALDNISVYENLPAGSLVGKISFTDEDVGQTGTYNLTVDDSKHFKLNGNRLEKALSADYETKTTHSVTIAVTDDGNPAKSMAKTFTIEVLNVNEPPVTIYLKDTGGQLTFSLDSPRVKENSALKTVVCTAVAYDEDANQSLAFTLDDDAGGRFQVSTGNAVKCSSINSINGAKTVCTALVRVNGSLNYEKNSNHSIIIRVTDKGGLFKFLSFTVEVVDVNEIPTDIQFAGGPPQVIESANGAIVGQMLTIDPDTKQTHSYILVDSAGGRFVIEGNTLKVSSSADLDYEEATEYTIKVTSTDSGNPAMSVTKMFIVKVIDVNEKPTLVQLPNNLVPENSGTGTIIGNLFTVDPDNFRTQWQTFKYELLDDDTGLFMVDGNVIKVKASNASCLEVGDQECLLNVEAHQQHTIVVRATDNGSPPLSIDYLLTINVTDVNDRPRGLYLSGREVFENANVGTLVAVLFATDEDRTQKLTFLLRNDNTGTFTIVGNKLLTAKPVDYEQKKAYNVTIVAKDNGNPSLEIAVNVTINVLNADEAPFGLNITDKDAQLNYTQDRAKVEEKSPFGTKVGKIEVGDPDENEVISFELTFNADGKFSLGPVSCQPITNIPEMNTVCWTILLVNGDLDYEAEAQQYIHVTANDTKGLFTTRSFVIEIVNVNDAPLDIKLNGNEVDENLDNHFIGNFSTTDQDLSDGHTYTLRGDYAELFVVKENWLYTAPKASLNFESRREYNLTVRSTDTGAPPEFREKTFLIRVRDVNEAPYNVSVSNLKIREDCRVNETVGVVSAVDPDNFGPLGKWQTHTCTIIDNAMGRFFVENNILKVAVANFDYETQSSWSIILRCFDSGSLQLYRDEPFLVTVVDVNEGPTQIQMKIGMVPENRRAGEVAATFATNDPDINETITYTIENPPVDFPFKIDGNNLKTTRSLDFEEKQSWKVTIRATDSGGLFTTETFQILVQDENDKPTGLGIIGPVFVPENSARGTYIGTVYTIDEDAKDTHNYSIVAVHPAKTLCFFELNSTTGMLTVAAEAIFDFETVKQYVVKISTTDSGISPLSFTGEVLVNISNINEKPVNITLNNTDIAEKSPYGTLVGVISVTDPDNEDSATHQRHICVVLNYPYVSFKIADNLNLIVTTDGLDYEQQASYTVEIRCFDDGIPSEFLDRRISIGITDVNEPPIYTGKMSYTVNENASVGEVIMTISFVDPDAAWAQKITYSHVMANESTLFRIDGTNLVTNKSLDYAKKSFYVFNLTATDTGVPKASTTVEITIYVKDTNDQPERVIFISSGVKEGSPGGTVVGLLGTLDRDKGQNYTYSVLGNASDMFYIEENKLILARGVELNYEKRKVFYVMIKAIDNGSPPLNCKTNITVRVLDENEPPEIFLQNNGTTNLTEDSPSGTIVVDISVIEEDFNQTHVCILLEGSEYFTITQESVVVANVLDHEKDPVVRVLIQCTDADQLSANASFFVYVTDINEPATDIILNGSRDIPEYSPIFSPIATISVKDPDRNQTHVCSLLGLWASFFTSPNNQQLIVAKDINVGFNGKHRHPFNLTIVCSDNGTPSLNFSQSFSFAIIDVNEPPAEVFVKGSTFVNENATVGYLIGRLYSDDPEGDRAAMFVILSVNSVEKSSDFYVVRNSSGSFFLYLNHSLNYDKVSSFMLEILVSDDRTPPASAVHYLTIDVRPTDPCALGTAGCDPGHGTCYRTGPTTNECFCNSGYEGDGVVCDPIDYCKTKIDTILLPDTVADTSPFSLCGNGECINGNDGYTCLCHAGFLPPDCSEADECVSNPCGRGGTCQDLVNGFTCHCLDGYTGMMCETDIDDCAASPCGPGTCADEVGRFSCSCPKDYTGAFCEFSTKACDSKQESHSCSSDRICIPKPSSLYVTDDSNGNHFCVSQDDEVVVLNISTAGGNLTDLKVLWERKLRDDIMKLKNSAVYVFLIDASPGVDDTAILTFVVILNDEPTPVGNVTSDLQYICKNWTICKKPQPPPQQLPDPTPNEFIWPIAGVLLGIVLIALSAVLTMAHRARKKRQLWRRRRAEVTFPWNSNVFGSRTNPLYSDDDVFEDDGMVDTWNPTYDSDKNVFYTSPTDSEPATFKNPLYEKSEEIEKLNPIYDSANETEEVEKVYEDPTEVTKKASLQ